MKDIHCFLFLLLAITSLFITSGVRANLSNLLYFEGTSVIQVSPYTNRISRVATLEVTSSLIGKDKVYFSRIYAKSSDLGKVGSVEVTYGKNCIEGFSSNDSCIEHTAITFKSDELKKVKPGTEFHILLKFKDCYGGSHDKRLTVKVVEPGSRVIYVITNKGLEACTPTPGQENSCHPIKQPLLEKQNLTSLAVNANSVFVPLPDSLNITSQPQDSFNIVHCKINKTDGNLKDCSKVNIPQLVVDADHKSGIDVDASDNTVVFMMSGNNQQSYATVCSLKSDGTIERQKCSTWKFHRKMYDIKIDSDVSSENQRGKIRVVASGKDTMVFCDYVPHRYSFSCEAVQSAKADPNENIGKFIYDAIHKRIWQPVVKKTKEKVAELFFRVYSKIKGGLKKEYDAPCEGDCLGLMADKNTVVKPIAEGAEIEFIPKPSKSNVSKEGVQKLRQTGDIYSDLNLQVLNRNMCYWSESEFAMICKEEPLFGNKEIVRDIEANASFLKAHGIQSIKGVLNKYEDEPIGQPVYDTINNRIFVPFLDSADGKLKFEQNSYTANNKKNYNYAALLRQMTSVQVTRIVDCNHTDTTPSAGCLPGIASLSSRMLPYYDTGWFNKKKQLQVNYLVLAFGKDCGGGIVHTCNIAIQCTFPKPKESNSTVDCKQLKP